MKRLFDIIVSLFLVTILLPIIIVVSLLIYIKLGAPVLFKQKRPGLNGKLYNIYKFRTMTDQRNELGFYLPDEIRLTKFGRMLRKYSLDELPQVLNVLKGELSLVGPRPLLKEYLDRYTPEQSRRHEVKPGITGWAQINGRNTIDWEEKFKLDIWYVDNRTFLLDLKILYYTIIKVIKATDINHQNNVTMREFEGNKSSQNMEVGK